MTAIAAFTKARSVTLPGYEVNDKAQAAVALTAGTIVSITSATPSYGFDKVVDKLPTADAKTQKKKYMVLMDAKAGQIVSLGDDGQMDGYVGLTPGDPLYPSGAVAGGIDTAAPTNTLTDSGSSTVAVPVEAHMWAETATRIRFRF